MSSPNNITSFGSWETLHNIASHRIHPDPSKTVRLLLLAMTVTCPSIGMLYLISSVRRLRSSGALWFFRIDAGGYIYPNTPFVAAFWAVLYTIVNTSALINFQIDLSTFLKWYTFVLHLSSYPLLFCFGWTKVWAAAYAAPPSGFRLGLHRRIDHFYHRRIVGVKLFNAVNIIMYISSFALTAPIATLSAKKLRDIEVLWYEYEGAHKMLKVGFAEPNPSPDVVRFNQALQVRILRILVELQSLADGILVQLRWLSGVFALLDLVVAGFCLSVSWKTLKILWCQAAKLRKCYHQKLALPQNVPDQDPSPSSTPKRTTISPTRSSSTHAPLTGRWIDKEVTASMWNFDLFRERWEDWEALDPAILREKYMCLRNYAINSSWHASLIFLSILAFVALDCFIVINVLDVPRRHRLTDLSLATTLWVNLVWNAGLGVILGTVTCVVAFSPSSIPLLPIPLQDNITLRRQNSKSNV